MRKMRAMRSASNEILHDSEQSVQFWEENCENEHTFRSFMLKLASGNQYNIARY